MKIKMICGTYGLWNGAGMTLKSPKDSAFDLPDDEARRLIGMNRAVSAGEEPRSPHSGDGSPGPDGPPGYDRTMKFARLQKAAQYYGVDTEGMKTKDELIEAIERKISEDSEAVDDGEEPPRVGVAPPTV